MPRAAPTPTDVPMHVPALHNSRIKPWKRRRLFLQLLRTSHNRSNRSLKAGGASGPSLEDRQKLKQPPTYQVQSYTQQFSRQDTTGSVHGDPTKNLKEVLIQRRFKPNFHLQTANPI